MSYLEKSMELLKENNINSASSVEYKVNDEVHTFRLYEIVENYMQASEESQEVFYKTLKIAIDENEVKSFFEKMGELLLMSSLAKSFPSS